MTNNEPEFREEPFLMTWRWVIALLVAIFCVGLFVGSTTNAMIADYADRNKIERPDAYCDGTTRVFLESDGDLELLPASIDCPTKEENGG